MGQYLITLPSSLHPFHYPEFCAPLLIFSLKTNNLALKIAPTTVISPNNLRRRYVQTREEP